MLYSAFYHMKHVSLFYVLCLVVNLPSVHLNYFAMMPHPFKVILFHTCNLSLFRVCCVATSSPWCSPGSLLHALFAPPLRQGLPAAAGTKCDPRQQTLGSESNNLFSHVGFFSYTLGSG
ncbi:hypothetical protein PVAP13_9NG592664 [Panicum virgatum]|uniref:Uncharacterized protein n=1 Tax=Panicum virgatum TaxID=38727 RepID=A0A8T0MZD2_PANVG|nr:hypothetical protein PVAP13_9NG592664 [Panicum virgatum]